VLTLKRSKIFFSVWQDWKSLWAGPPWRWEGLVKGLFCFQAATISVGNAVVWNICRGERSETVSSSSAGFALGYCAILGFL